MSPLQKIGLNPSDYEAGPTARWLVNSLGLRRGLITNGLLELFSIAAILSAAILSSVYFFKVEIFLAILFWNALVFAYFSFIIRNNYEFGKRSRKTSVIV